MIQIAVAYKGKQFDKLGENKSHALLRGDKDDEADWVAAICCIW